MPKRPSLVLILRYGKTLNATVCAFYGLDCIWGYGEVLADKSTMHILTTQYWGCLIVLWSFHLVCFLCCGCLNFFCNVWLSVCAGFWQLYVCFGNMCTCIYCVSYCLYCFFVLFPLCIFILICFVCTSVRTTATEWKLNCSKLVSK